LADLRGKIVVLNFWATWCPPCRAETPAFVQLQKEFEGQGVQFVGVSVDESATPVQSFVEEFGVEYPIAVDDGTVEPLYKDITGYPTTYLINRRGEIERYMPGALSRERLQPELWAMLEKDLD
jgi:thiol-disulfide isomerase/thioredoxin